MASYLALLSFSLAIAVLFTQLCLLRAGGKQLK